jgi:hypothetical protein
LDEIVYSAHTKALRDDDGWLQGARVRLTTGTIA